MEGNTVKLMPDTGDLFLDMNVYCERFYQDCKQNPGDYSPDALKSLIRSWVLNVKLAPVSSALCNISLESPFCLSATRLQGLVPAPEGIKIDTSANFNFEPTPIPTKATDSPPTRSIPPDDECIRHGPHFCSISR